MITAFRLTIVMALVAFPGCSSDGITEPKCDRCDEMRVVTDRPEYRPGSVIAFSLTNRTSAVLRYDWCSVAIASRGSSEEFQTPYSPARRCGYGAGLPDVLEHMVLISPGETLRDSATISSGAVQSQYRIHLWLLDENGLPESGNPVASNIFDVYPGADRAIGSR
jgi:hypothetical protein